MTLLLLMVRESHSDDWVSKHSDVWLVLPSLMQTKSRKGKERICDLRINSQGANMEFGHFK